MTLSIVTFALGPAHTNAYLIADPQTHEAAVIDPSWDGLFLLAEAQKRGWRIGHLWYTHAHFDHLGGAAALADALNPLPLTALHPADHALWQSGGGGKALGFVIDPGPEPVVELEDGQILRLGSSSLQVLHTPGHTPGHVVFFCAQEKVCFCGDLIFAGSVGRTDLPGGSWQQLQDSIRQKIYTLPEDTHLLPGHGAPTLVAEEKVSNPFVQEA